jgi:hypothetical protein
VAGGGAPSYHHAVRFRVTYGRAADLVADAERQFARGGLLVSVPPPDGLERGVHVELEIVSPHGRACVDATVIAPLPGAGVAVGFDVSDDALATMVSAGRDAPGAGDGGPPHHELIRPGSGREPTSPGPVRAPTAPGSGRAPTPAGTARAPTSPGAARTPAHGVAFRPSPAPAAARDLDPPTAPARPSKVAALARPPYDDGGGTDGGGTDGGRTTPDALGPGGLVDVGDDLGIDLGELPLDLQLDDPVDPDTVRERPGDLAASAAVGTTTAFTAADATTAQKIQRALHGDRNDRLAMLRDINKSLHPYVLRNPGIQADEIAWIARQPTVAPDALAYIAGKREWIQKPEIAAALVRNPKTPPPLAIKLLDLVAPSELRLLAKQTNVRDAIQRAARKKLLGPQ